jgi:hypothetical protein
MKYAAYGSNLHPVRLRERVASARLIKAVAVADWQLRFHKKGSDGSGKCNIVPAEDFVCFAVFEISAGDKLRLDEIEGLNQGYDETVIDIPGLGRCFAYIASESHVDDSLKPYGWYRELVLAGAEYHRFPRPYTRKVRAVEYQVDNDTQRHERHMALVARALSR